MSQSQNPGPAPSQGAFQPNQNPSINILTGQQPSINNPFLQKSFNPQIPANASNLAQFLAQPVLQVQQAKCQPLDPLNDSQFSIFSCTQSYTYLQQQLIQAVRSSLEHEIFSNASFLCELLYSEVKNEEVKLLLAECYLGENKIYKAYEVLRNSVSPMNKYKFALTCMKLNKYTEAEKAFLHGKVNLPSMGSQDFKNLINTTPNGAYGLYIFASILERNNKKNYAYELYSQALALDSTLWVAFERIQRINGNAQLDPTVVFNDKNPGMAKINHYIQQSIEKQLQAQVRDHRGQSQADGLQQERNGASFGGLQQQSPSQAQNQPNIQSALQQSQNPFLGSNQLSQNSKGVSIMKSPSNQDMKENQESSASARRVGGGNSSDESLNSSNLMNNNSINNGHNLIEDDAQSYSVELKTPTGQSASQYATPISGMQQTQKKQGTHAPSHTNQHQSRIHHNQTGANNSAANLGSSSTSNVVNQLNFQMNDSQLADGPAAGQQIGVGSSSVSNGAQPNQVNTLNSSTASAMGDPITIKPFTISTPNINLQNANQNNQLSSTPISSNNQVSSFDANIQSAQRIDNRRAQQQFQLQQQTHQMPTSLANPFMSSPSQQQNLGAFRQFTAPGPIQSSVSPIGRQNYLSPHHIAAITSLPQPINYTYNLLRCSKGPVELPDLTSLLRVLGHGFQCISIHKCHEAIEIFSRLNKVHYDSGFVLQHLGKAYQELLNYKEAERMYLRMRQVQPWRMEGLDFYSAVLYQMRKQTDLTYLSHSMLENAHYAPETWVVAGNCLSLQKEHEIALKYLERAIQLNPTYAYAYTLQGIEYSDNEDFLNATKVLKKALQVDDKYYLAFYALANACIKQENFGQAESYLEQGLKINPRSLHMQNLMGTVKFRREKPLEALPFFDKALEIDPTFTQAMFQRNTVLQSLSRHEEALQMLLQLERWAPREPQLFHEMGNLYKKLHMKEKAFQAWTKSLDLDPKDPYQIKNKIDKLHTSGNGSDIHEEQMI